MLSGRARTQLHLFSLKAFPPPTDHSISLFEHCILYTVLEWVKQLRPNATQALKWLIKRDKPVTYYTGLFFFIPGKIQVVRGGANKPGTSNVAAWRYAGAPTDRAVLTAVSLPLRQRVPHSWVLRPPVNLPSHSANLKIGKDKEHRTGSNVQIGDWRKQSNKLVLNLLVFLMTQRDLISYSHFCDPNADSNFIRSVFLCTVLYLY